ncbi:hypothetical protein P7K49_023278 [Saguinus oedipus]|uniref:Uncharacterized protein n=1 Tax=Saguinus oedipus TaxID=9490 RepID=A0ABQ9UL60_SAGOE|nr:hypothetical protein P7K49_023278 [Saguinus oedipus]
MACVLLPWPQCTVCSVNFSHQAPLTPRRLYIIKQWSGDSPGSRGLREGGIQAEISAPIDLCGLSPSGEWSRYGRPSWGSRNRDGLTIGGGLEPTLAAYALTMSAFGLRLGAATPGGNRAAGPADPRGRTTTSSGPRVVRPAPSGAGPAGKCGSEGSSERDLLGNPGARRQKLSDCVRL